MDEKICRIGGEAVIGYTPEHMARQIWLDISQWMDMWPEAVPVMMVVRPGENEAYRADAEVDGKNIVWTIQEYDAEKPGTGEMWVVFRREDDNLVGITPGTSVIIRRGPPGMLHKDRR